MNQSTKNETIEALDKPGREKFKLLCRALGISYGEPQNKRLAYDCFIKLANKTYLVELKDQNPKYEAYEEHFLQVDKYNRLMAWKERLNADGVFYVRWFGRRCYWFLLDDPRTTSNPTRRYMNQYTYLSRTNKVEKDIYLLHRSWAAAVYDLDNLNANGLKDYVCGDDGIELTSDPNDDEQ